MPLSASSARRAPIRMMQTMIRKEGRDSMDEVSEHWLDLTRILPAGRRDIFAAWTTAANVQQWMCPEAVSIPQVELDVRVGGAFRVDMLIDGAVVTHTGVYREVTPPEKLVFTWISQNTLHRETLVTVVLHALGDESTELRLTQALLPTEDTTQQHTRGWTQIVDHLATYRQMR
jgi:uncharacterized protein YndB with AHSA1/START domain